MRLTERQRDVLRHLSYAGVTGSGYDGSVLHALAAKKLVMQHHNQAPGYVYYTWTLTDAGKAAAQELKISPQRI